MKKNKEQKGSILYSKKDLSVFDRRANYFKQSKEKSIDKLNSLTKFSSRQNIAKLLAQYEIFNITKGVTGDIIEGGVYFGSGLFGWANIAVSKEPFNYQCKILGFDTFEGSKGVTAKDKSSKNIIRREGEYNANNYHDLQKAIEIFDLDRPLSHIKKIELIKGDISKTVPKYCAGNKQQTVRILHLGMNLYKPTLIALKHFMPRMKKGSIIAIDGLNHATAGCMDALNEVTKNKNYKLQNFDFYPNFTFLILN